MTTTTATSTRSRRGMLVGTTAALVGATSLAVGRSAAAATDEGQDSELLTLCAEFHRTQADLDRWHATGFRREPLDRETEVYKLWQAEDDRFFWANHHAFEAVRDTPAKTQVGIIAKCKVLSDQMDRLLGGLEGGMCGASNCEVFAYQLIRNMVGIGEGAA